MYLGDYHTHTVYSHGKGTIEENVLQARKKGLKQIAVTDHGFGHIAYGVKRGKFAEMRKETDRLNAQYPDIKVLLGLECNLISSDGDIDLREGEEKLLDVIVCGFHKFADIFVCAAQRMVFDDGRHIIEGDSPKYRRIYQVGRKAPRRHNIASQLCYKGGRARGGAGVQALRNAD